MRIENPFHEGEVHVQERLGEVEEGRRNGRVIADTILSGALKFIEQQPLAVVGSVDSEERVWASVLTGKPGFMRAPDDESVEIDFTQTAGQDADPLWKNIERHPDVGMLVIDLGSRRRLRINGRIARSGDDQLRLEVRESYPNCPKYIQRRQLSPQLSRSASPTGEALRGQSLGVEQEALIRSADTFFVASAHPERGVDASHRGGQPGFVHVLDDRRIRVPDYEGNRMFNTLGNFVVNPGAGLVFVDFKRNRTLQLTGRAEIQWDLEDPENETGGTRRYWDFEVEAWQESDLAHPFKWEFLDASPFNPAPGTNGGD